MTFTLWVLPYSMNRFPQDQALGYWVFQYSHVPHCAEACRHKVESTHLRQAKCDARVLHANGVNCMKGVDVHG